MKWADVIADENLRNLPYKIELDRYGNILMSPASNWHGRLQVWIASLLERNLSGEAISECLIDTPEGVKVADVVWCSPVFLSRCGYQTPYPFCAGYLRGNPLPFELRRGNALQNRLAPQAGSKGGMVVLETGGIRFFGSEGERSASIFSMGPRPELNH